MSVVVTLHKNLLVWSFLLFFRIFLLVCIRMYPYVSRMLVVCIRMYSYVPCVTRMLPVCTGVVFQSWSRFKDVRAHCYCASLVRTLFIGHARATSFSSARTESKTQQNTELMTFALTWCANIFVGRSVTPTFFSADRFLFWLFPLY